MNQSHKMENSRPKSLAKHSVPKVQKKSPRDDFNLCGKPSFIVCKGRRIPDLNEVTSDISDLEQKQAGEEAILKIQSIVKRQSCIMSWVDCILFRKTEVTQGVSQSADPETDDSIGK
ncbi:uncharacterized protein LOC117589413 [Drosophila guanche]|uniref:Uncharacterized protein n=1 Tax=Drosophila guanche TaxID=7266 RepID=A0A3B0JZ99_DROGU|nr:uncharacterized protein LOC117589413 [Drosophila guanche]SPP87405.1 Hypothetical predicted protein [Drosophila guanche]